MSWWWVSEAIQRARGRAKPAPGAGLAAAQRLRAPIRDAELGVVAPPGWTVEAGQLDVGVMYWLPRWWHPLARRRHRRRVAEQLDAFTKRFEEGFGG